tara:strand:+ start:90 stop:653 length:564 start_codon:yes stop_codon:yes gene_type:complete
MKIFFLGGTFDPPHLGHLRVAERCLEDRHCDRFIFIPSKQNPFKNKPFFSSKDRYEMLKTMTDKMSDKIIIDSFELESKSDVNYSIDTIKYLIKKYKPCSLYMVIGQDILKSLSDWKDWSIVQKMVKIVCVNRPGYNYNSNVDINIKIKNIDINLDSTLIRSKIQSNNLELIKKSLDYRVFNYIQDI